MLEYDDLLPQVDKTPEMVVFSHNDIHETNFLHTFDLVDGRKKIKEIKLIDFEYSNYNYRGFDLAMYLDQSTSEFTFRGDVQFNEKTFPSFDSYKEGTMDVDLCIKTYLERFYEKHLPNVIPEWDQYEKYASKEVYINTEFPVMKEQVKCMLLLQDLGQTVWCFVMQKGFLIDPTTGKLWDND